MKVIKPQRLGLLQRVVEHERRYTLAVAVLVYFPLEHPRNLLSEASMWRELGDKLPMGILDEGFPKPCGEVLVTGSAYAPYVDGKPQPASAVMAGVTIEQQDNLLLDKRIAVLGDRFWKGRSPTDPIPFEHIPIDWEHAFGGEKYPHNPLGKGMAEIETEHGRVTPLPNIEDPNHLILAPGDKPPRPAGFGPVDLTWPQRMKRRGKRYDARWLKTRFPGPAEDFDAHFYNRAPEDQWIYGFFRGDETIRIQGMHPRRETIVATLEPLVTKVLVTQRTKDGEQFKAILTRPETLLLFPDLERGVLIHRATMEIAEDDADDIVHLMIAAESPSSPKAMEHYRRVLELRLDKSRCGIESLRESDLLPPADEGWTIKADMDGMAELLKPELLLLENTSRGREKGLKDAKLALIEAGFEVDDSYDQIPEPMEIADPEDLDGIYESIDQLEKLQAKTEQELEEKKKLLEERSREAFKEQGLDYEEVVAQAALGGPIARDFSADKHLMMLHDMYRIAAEGDVDLPELERDLTDPKFEESLRQLEKLVRESYLQSAHLQPAAAIVDEEAQSMLRTIVVAAKDGGESLAGRSLNGADLRGLDLRGLDLSGAMLESADLSDTDLSGANLSRAVLARANLTDTNLLGADLCRANLGLAQLTRTNLTDAKLSETVFMRSHIDGAVLSNAEINKVTFLETELKSADLSHTRGEMVIFLQSDMRRVNLTGARFRKVLFIEIDLRGVDFTGAQLDETQFITCQGDEACFTGASLRSSVFVHGSSFQRCSFVDADLHMANFRKTPLTRGDFESAVLEEADLSSCDLRRANLHRISARACRMVRTDLSGANLRGAHLLEAILQKAVLLGADLTGANLSRGDLSLAQMDDNTKMAETLMLNTRLEPRYADKP